VEVCLSKISDGRRTVRESLGLLQIIAIDLLHKSKYNKFSLHICFQRLSGKQKFIHATVHVLPARSVISRGSVLQSFGEVVQTVNKLKLISVLRNYCQISRILGNINGYLSSLICISNWSKEITKLKHCWQTLQQKYHKNRCRKTRSY
jgi:hypothetical protein